MVRLIGKNNLGVIPKTVFETVTQNKRKTLMGIDKPHLLFERKFTFF
ncbi:hypothetical protein RintRC_1928 [Richelia intracellularis]|nr:hypothetical protein RintRC_1928 [Richelia intracellularis]